MKKLTALLRLALALLRSSGFTLTHERLPDGRAKIRILRAVDRAREFVPLRALLRFLRLSPSRFHAWRRLQHACALDDQSSCPHTSPHRLTPLEVRTIEEMVTALEYRHVPTGTLAVLAQRLGKVSRKGPLSDPPPRATAQIGHGSRRRFADPARANQRADARLTRERSQAGDLPTPQGTLRRARIRR